MELDRYRARMRHVSLALFFATTLLPVTVRAQAPWIVNVPPERLLNWRPRTAEDFAHPEVLLGQRSPANITRLTPAPATATPIQASWREMGPPARCLHRVVYDSRRHRLLLLGGYGAYDPGGSVWACPLPSGPWTQIATLPWASNGVWGGSSVQDAVYDSLRDRLLVAPANGTLDLEALSLGGAPAWSHVWTGPAAPSGFAGMAIDTRRDQLAILGVWDATAAAHQVVRVPLANPSSWTSAYVQGGQPAASSRGAAVYDAARDTFDVLFDYGSGSESEYARLLAVNGAGTPTWGAIFAPPFPDGSAVHMLQLDAARDRLLLTNDNGAVLALGQSPYAPEWLTAGDLSGRYYPAAAFDPVGRRLWIDGGVTDDMLEMPNLVTPVRASAAVDSGVAYSATLPASGTVASWMPVADETIGSRWFDGLKIDSLGAQALLWGYRLTGYYTRPLSGASGWVPLTSAAPAVAPSVFGSLVLDPVEHAGYVFDARTVNGVAQMVVWKQSFEAGGAVTALDVQGPNPGALRFASTCYDAANRRILLVGGDDGSNYNDKAWELRLGPAPTWHPLSVSDALPRYSQLFPDPVGGGFWCMHYGPWRIGYVRYVADTLVYTEDMPAQDLPASALGADFIDYDPVHRQMLFFPDAYQGYSVDLGDLWVVSLGGPTADWELRSIAGPVPADRGFFAYTYDPVSNRVMLDGGQKDNGPNYADTWLLQLPIDSPTAVLVSLVQSSEDAAGVHLRWNVSAPIGTPCAVERSTNGVEWVNAGGAAWSGPDEVDYSGAPLPAGTRVAFRLRVSGDAGAPVWVGGPAIPVALALSPLSNPSRGGATLRLALGADAPAHVRVLDVGGRVVSEASLPAGTQRWSVSGSLRPGLYFAELEQSGKRAVARLVIAP